MPPSNFFIGKFRSDGTYLWSKVFGSTKNDEAKAVGVDSFNNIFITGYFDSSLNLGLGVMTPIGARDAFLAKFTPTGTAVWTKAIPGSGMKSATSIAVDFSGDVAVAGYFDRDINLGAGTVNSSAWGQNTTFMAKYSGSATGLNPNNYLWGKILLGSGYNLPSSIVTDSMGNVITTGSFQGTATIDSQTLTSAGWEDMFLLKLNPH